MRLPSDLRAYRLRGGAQRAQLLRVELAVVRLRGGGRGALKLSPLLGPTMRRHRRAQAQGQVEQGVRPRGGALGVARPSWESDVRVQSQTARPGQRSQRESACRVRCESRSTRGFRVIAIRDRFSHTQTSSTLFNFQLHSLISQSHARVTHRFPLITRSQLAGRGHLDGGGGGAALATDGLHLLDHVHALGHLAEDAVLAWVGLGLGLG